MIVGLFSFVLGVVAFLWFMVEGGLDPALGYGGMGVSVVAVVLLSLWLLRVRREAPERIVGFLQRLGFYRYRG